MGSRLLLVAAALLGMAHLLADSGELKPLLKRVEKRYNSAKTIRVLFEQTYTAQGRPARTEKGELFLRKPGKMLWQYTLPAGKLFESDGKFVYLYTPSTNRVERTPVKESDDMRAPLAFLLGKLDFDRDFTHFQSRTDGSGTTIQAVPKSDRLPYTSVDFSVSPQFEIVRLKVTGQDNSIVEFRFAQEQINPALNGSMFQFRMPPGAELVSTDELGASTN